MPPAHLLLAQITVQPLSRDERWEIARCLLELVRRQAIPPELYAPLAEPPERIRALVWGKTYPRLSSHPQETVCTGAVTEAGEPLRLYPVPLRHMDSTKHDSLYDWIEVEVERNSDGQRYKSRKIRPELIVQVGHIASSASDERQVRREIIMADPRWQFDSIESLKVAQRAEGRSMGVLRLGEVVCVRAAMNGAEGQRAHEAKHTAVTAQTDIFRAQSLPLDSVPFEIKLRFRCAAPCAARELPAAVARSDQHGERGCC